MGISKHLKVQQNSSGFTIVELLIVIVVIAILAAISIVAYNGIQNRAKAAKRDSDITQLEKAIHLARAATNKQTVQITGFGMTSYACANGTGWGNTTNVEPKTMDKSGACWANWYTSLDNLSAASGMNLSGLKAGDANGNPYFFNENDGEGNGGNYCLGDDIGYFTGNGGQATITKSISSARGSSCASL